MYDEHKWVELVEQFRTENYRLYQLSSQSVFTVALQAGLSALKTPLCYRPLNDRNYECPVCQVYSKTRQNAACPACGMQPFDQKTLLKNRD